MYVHLSTHAHIYSYICTYIYIHVHTHAYTGKSKIDTPAKNALLTKHSTTDLYNARFLGDDAMSVVSGVGDMRYPYISAYMYIYRDMYANVYIHTRIYIYIYTYIYIHL